jgi:hypothetical protein
LIQAASLANPSRVSPALVDEARKIHVKTIASIKYGYTLAGNRRDVIESGALPALKASTSEIAMVDPSEWRTRGRADNDDLAEERFERGRVIGRPKVLESGDRLWTFVCEDGLRCECVPSRFIRFDSLKLSTLQPRKPRLLLLCEVALTDIVLEAAISLDRVTVLTYQTLPRRHRGRLRTHESVEYGHTQRRAFAVRVYNTLKKKYAGFEDLNLIYCYEVNRRKRRKPS